MLNGKVEVLLTAVCSLSFAVVRWPTGKCVSGRHHQIRAELGPMPTWVVRMVAGVVLGSYWGVAGDRERVGPCSVSSRMLNLGLGLGLAP